MDTLLYVRVTIAFTELHDKKNGRMVYGSAWRVARFGRMRIPKHKEKIMVDHLLHSTVNRIQREQRLRTLKDVADYLGIKMSDLSNAVYASSRPAKSRLIDAILNAEKRSPQA